MKPVRLKKLVLTPKGVQHLLNDKIITILYAYTSLKLRDVEHPLNAVKSNTHSVASDGVTRIFNEAKYSRFLFPLLRE